MTDNCQAAPVSRYSMAPVTRTLVRLAQAADELSVPRATVRAWASEPNQRISPIGLDLDGVNLYDLEEIRQLAATTRRRRRRKTT